MSATLRYANDTYWRDAEGVWRYRWGDRVPGAVDLTLSDLLAIDDHADESLTVDLDRRTLAWLTGEDQLGEAVHVRPNGSRSPNAGDIVVGMHAPELQVTTMLTVSDIARMAGVSKATIDSYRYRGYLPAPQAVQGRTPLWARPVVARWLRTRPGSGWRSDIYGEGAEVAGTSGADR